MKKNFVVFILALIMSMTASAQTTWTPHGGASGGAVSASMITFTAGQAVTAGNYQVGRDADATNQLHFNAPAGTTMEFSFNDVPRILFSDAVAGNIENISCATTTTGFCLNIGDADSLTSGAILRLKSNSPSVTGKNLAFIRNQNVLAVGTTVANFEQDSTGTNLLLTSTGNGRSLVIDSSATSANALRFNTTAQTTAAIISVPNADSLSTGNALNFVSNSPDTNVRSLAFIRNQNPLSISATALFVQQDSTANAFRVDSTGDSTSMVINSAATTANAINFSQSTQTSGFLLNASNLNSVTSGGAFNFVSNSPSATVRNLGNLRNQNTAASSTTVLNVQQDASANGINITENGNGSAMNINGSGVSTQNVFNIIADGLTTGTAATINSNSANISNRSILSVNNLNAGATGATALSISQNSTNIGVNVSRAAVNSNQPAFNITDAGTGTGTSISVGKSGANYSSNLGVVDVQRTGSYTGVDTQTGVDFTVRPNFTLTEPGAGSFNQFGASIDMSNVAVTAGAGTSTVAALNLTAGTDADAGTNLALNAKGDSKFQGRILGTKNNDVVAAGTITVPGGNAVTLTGNTNIDFITTTGWTSGSILILQFTGTPTVNNNTGGAPGGTASVLLSGSANFGATANDTLILYYDGGNWREISRTVI